MIREYRIFEVDQYENKWFVCSRNSLELAEYYIKNVLGGGPEYQIFDENNEPVVR